MSCYYGTGSHYTRKIRQGCYYPDTHYAVTLKVLLPKCPRARSASTLLLFGQSCYFVLLFVLIFVLLFVSLFVLQFVLLFVLLFFLLFAKMPSRTQYYDPFNIWTVLLLCLTICLTICHTICLTICVCVTICL